VRHLAPCLLLVPALLLLLLATPAHAGDDDGATTRLERRVEMLLDLVADLHAQVEALSARVAQLEGERGAPVPGATGTRPIVRDEPEAAPAAPKSESIPATPLVPAPIVVWPEVSGVYALDKEASVEAILAVQLDGVEDEEMAEMIREGIASEFRQVTITLSVEADGTFHVRLQGTGEEEEEGEESTARGTWTRDETRIGKSQRLLFLTTHEDGVEDTNPKELVGTWEDGRLVLQEDDGDADSGGYVMVFRRT
jgi:hypothetical protein